MSSLLSKTEISRSFNQAAASYDASAIIQREVADRLLERLDYIRLDPQVIIDLGSGTGYCTKSLINRYPQAQILGLDLAEAMLKQAKSSMNSIHWCCADAESLPIADHSVDLIISNLMFQWIQDLPKAFQEIKRILKPGGLFMFSTKGPDTLRELRDAWKKVDAEWHVHEFIDMHDLGDHLLSAGFMDPVMDAQRITMHYQEIPRLLRDLKEIGAHNCHLERSKGLLGKQKYQAFLKAYETFRTETGKFPATYEILIGSAWIPAGEMTYQANAAGEINIPVSALRKRGAVSNLVPQDN